MGGRSRAPARSMSDAIVSDVGLVPTTPETVCRGTWDVWPALRDPGSPAAVERGEYDDRIEELHDYAAAHDPGGTLHRATSARLRR